MGLWDTSELLLVRGEKMEVRRVTDVVRLGSLTVVTAGGVEELGAEGAEGGSRASGTGVCATLPAVSRRRCCR